jgi:predicted dienelactone hydrolase
MGLVVSLLVAASPLRPLRAAEQLQVQLDGMVIPLQIDELVAWGRSGGVSNSELGIWLNLLEPDSREGVLELLRAPLIYDRSMARQLLGSWAGRRLLDEVADIVRVDDDSAGDTLLNTLESLLNRQEQVSSLDLLEALPASHVRLDLDALLQAAGHWRQQLQRQQQLVRRLASAARDQAAASPALAASSAASSAALGAREPEIQLLPVNHRAQALRLQLWRPQPGAPAHRTWLVWMPGLGGSPDHFRWLGRALSQRGWSVLVLEHPGSDAEAVKALLDGRRPPPGAEVIPDRLRDLEAVLAARRSGTIALPGEQLVLGGHSLGALTALLGAGARPRSGLDRRCATALDDLPLSNLSRLLQCQLTEVALPSPPAASTPPADLVGLIGMNSFGSLLWPRNRPLQLPVPVLFSGGSLDLITPPQSEQLGLMLALAPHPASRAVVVDGASHFSPVRVEGQAGEAQGEDLFRLGKELVGVQPLQVQTLLEDEIVAFLEQLEGSRPEAAAAQTSTLHRRIGDLQLHRLNRDAAARLLAD